MQATMANTEQDYNGLTVNRDRLSAFNISICDTSPSTTLLTLPCEIRDMILGHVVPAAGITNVSRDRFGSIRTR